jgi:hypothetical protein
MTGRAIAVLTLIFLLARTALAADHRIEKLEEGAPADAVGSEIAPLLNETGFKVIRGASRTVCEFWLRKELPTSGAAASSGVNYPFNQGEIIGVVRFPRSGSDFRDQDIAEGVYTMRYGLQPVDGAHVGTFPTRDFLLLSKAEEDQSPAPADIKALTEKSAEAAETNHPAILALVKLEEKAESYPSITANEEKEWEIARLEVAIKSGDQAQKIPLDLIVAGRAEE